MTVFVIAMDSEAQAVICNLASATRSTSCGKKIIRGTLCGKQTAVVICGVGKVNAACGVQYAIDALAADKIINMGVAGGLNANMRPCEIYGISEAVQYDFDLAQLNGTSIGTLNEFDRAYLPLNTTNRYALKRIGTGDRFNDSPLDFKLLTDTLKADIRDMECAAMAQVCIHAGVEFYAFKGISDVAGSGSTTEQFTKNLAECNAKLAAAVPEIFMDVDNG